MATQLGAGLLPAQQQQQQQQQPQAEHIEDLFPLVGQLTNPEQRESALLELSKKREAFSDLAPILWHSFGTISALLQEIVAIYPMLSPPTLTPHASNRVCNALALLQCVASHPETRSVFLNAHIPLYLYPFLNTVSKSRPFEYLRLTSLGVIGALVKMDDSDVITFLLQTEIIPLCLRIMETGSELSKTVATFIVQKVSAVRTQSTHAVSKARSASISHYERTAAMYCTPYSTISSSSSMALCWRIGPQHRQPTAHQMQVSMLTHTLLFANA
jgi:Cell differentiation family, Rcd1-like